VAVVAAGEAAVVVVAVCLRLLELRLLVHLQLLLVPVASGSKATAALHPRKEALPLFLAQPRQAVDEAVTTTVAQVVPAVLAAVAVVKTPALVERALLAKVPMAVATQVAALLVVVVAVKAGSAVTLPSAATALLVMVALAVPTHFARDQILPTLVAVVVLVLPAALWVLEARAAVVQVAIPAQMARPTQAAVVALVVRLEVYGLLPVTAVPVLS
jgi:hypothetical protein